MFEPLSSHPMEAPTAGAVQAELEEVLQCACSALACQEAGRLQDALQGYYLARSRVRYVLEALLRPMAEAQQGDGDVAVVAAACSLLDETYSLAVEQLSCASGSVGSEDAEGTQQLPDSAGGGTQRSMDAGQQLRQPCGGVGGGGMPGSGSGGRGGKGAAGQGGGLPEAVQQCVREVQGSLDEVVGLDAIKQELREAVLLPMGFPQLFTGIRRPQCNLLFHGVPGTGKTMLVEKLAAEAGTPLLCISPSAILSKWAGESEKSVRAVFEAAAALSPAIVFIDEVDSLAPARSSGDELASRRVLTELLIQMTAATNRPGAMVFVLACTNRPQDCDPALLRRFDRKIEVPPPDAAARAAFFEATALRPEVASSLSTEELCQLAEATDGCTGSDLSMVCRDAAMAPLRELMQQRGLHRGQGGEGVIVRPVTFDDFVAAVQKMRASAAAGPEAQQQRQVGRSECRLAALS